MSTVESSLPQQEQLKTAFERIPLNGTEISELSDMLTHTADTVSTFASPSIVQDSIRCAVTTPAVPTEFIDHLVHGDGNVELLTAEDKRTGSTATKLIIRKKLDTTGELNVLTLNQAPNGDGWSSLDPDQDSVATFTNHEVIALLRQTTSILEGHYIDPNMQKLGAELNRRMQLTSHLARLSIRLYGSGDVHLDRQQELQHQQHHRVDKRLIRATTDHAIQDIMMLGDALILPGDIKISRALRFSSRKPMDAEPTTTTSTLQFSSHELSTDALRSLVQKAVTEDRDYAGTLRRSIASLGQDFDPLNPLNAA